MELAREEEFQLVESHNTLGSERGRRREIESNQNSKVLDTPRTKEACRRLGLVLEDLQFRSFDQFAIPGDLKEKQQLRFDHFEKRRKERLAQVLAERAKVIAQNAKKGEAPGAQSGQFLSMLESLFEKEAKRLESDLKGQLRAHSSLVKENEEQLRKEGQLQDRMNYREQRRQEAQKQYSQVAEQTRQKVEQKFQRKDEIVAQLGNGLEERQAQFAKARLAEDERMERFLLEKKQNEGDKSAAFRDKLEKMKEKTTQLDLERKVEQEQKKMEMEMRIKEVQQRREEDQRMRQVRSEEQHLHIMDVREAKSRIDRVDGYRRDELREQVDNNVERIETLLALKDQLLDQRRARNMKAEATKNSRGLNLRRDCAPGPGQYEAPESSLVNQPSTKMGKASQQGFLDEVTKVAKELPPPGAYEVKLLANGKSVEKTHGPVAFPNRNRDSYLDEAIKQKDAIPAPGQYNNKSGLDQRGLKMMRERIVDTAGDKYSVKKLPTWQRPATETPGPAGYSVDEYTRKEVLRRAQRSLPNLTRDMLGGAHKLGSAR